MAVKKATAKKSVAKKATAKAPKKSVTKKSPAKKVAKKKTTSKATSTKKAAVKKSTTKKSAVKKAVTKKSAVKKAVAKKGAETIVIPEAPISTSRNARVEIVSTPAPAPVIIPAASTPAPMPEKKAGASGRVIFAVVVGILLLGLIVWAKSHNPSTNGTASTTPTATASATTSATPTPTPSPSNTSVILTAHEAPQGVVAHYTSTGATIYWKAPSAVDGLTGYNVEISVSSGPWKLISTVPVAQLSLDVKKENSSGWTSFKVSSVYSDSQTAPAKAFGLPGTYS